MSQAEVDGKQEPGPQKYVKKSLLGCLYGGFGPAIILHTYGVLEKMQKPREMVAGGPAC